MAGLPKKEELKLNPNQNWQLEKARKIIVTATILIDQVNEELGSNVLGVCSHRLDVVRAELGKFQNNH